MSLQRLLLRLMLAALAVSAAVGVVAVFFSTSMLGRIAGTMFVSAICIGLAIPSSRMLDRGDSRQAGFVNLSSIVAAFILLTGGIWADLNPTLNIEFRLIGTGVVVLVGGMISGNVLNQRSRKGMAVACVAVFWSAITSMGLFIAAIWTDYPVADGLAESGGHLIGAGLAAGLCLVGFGVSTRPWQWVGLATSVAQAGFGLWLAWYGEYSDVRWYTALACVSGVIGHANVVTRVRMGEHGLWVAMAAIGGTASAGACLSVLGFLTDGFHGSGPDPIVRLLAATSLIATCGTLAVVIMFVLHRRGSPSVDPSTRLRTLWIACPHCSRKQWIPAGRAACAQCGLLFALTIREPHCERCEYPLLGVSGDRCPECGTPRGNPEDGPPPASELA